MMQAPMYDLIESMFFAYRDFVGDADRLLASDGFGRAHHRVLYFVVRRPGLTIAELLEILQITKQSLNRVLKDLLDRSFVRSRSGETDRRRRLLFATERGEALIGTIAAVQSARFERVFGVLGADAKLGAMAFLTAMVEASDGADVKPVKGREPGVGRRLDFMMGEMAVVEDFDRPGLDEADRRFRAGS